MVLRELAVAKKQVCNEWGEIHDYEYSILVGEIEISPQIYCESYGVKVKDCEGDQEEIEDITISSSRIDELIDLLVRNIVTPCTLKEVVEDWL